MRYPSHVAFAAAFAYEVAADGAPGRYAIGAQALAAADGGDVEGSASAREA